MHASQVYRLSGISSQTHSTQQTRAQNLICITIDNERSMKVAHAHVLWSLWQLGYNKWERGQMQRWYSTETFSSFIFLPSQLGVVGGVKWYWVCNHVIIVHRERPCDLTVLSTQVGAQTDVKMMHTEPILFLCLGAHAHTRYMIVWISHPYI